MRIALVQLRLDPNEPQEARVDRASALITAQSGADLVVLPELWRTGAFAVEAIAAGAEPLDGPTVSALASAAREASVHLLGGSIVERGEDGALHNTSVLLDPSGSLLHTYRKVHLFGFDSGEAALVTAGEAPTCYRTPFAAVGFSTCYDLRFPEIYRLLLDEGAELVVVPAGWPTPRLEHWRLLLRARAIENQVFVAGCNTAGSDGAVVYGGRSAIVDPWGAVLAEAGDGEEVLTVDVDLASVAKIREEFPILRDRRLGVPAPR
jgi:predicted amidohydrolase